ncbi:MAG: FAD:protein FMN transferase [Armatimonadota bacterium]|nr:FAD:protein FMN transferase [Armatimonadota bacterium]MCX7777800.1 FAD:protein FMN transferase [Armatimonadota bacterium]MDW8025914.1 FAD:protein FMN transferase [Armatimonadota bacterium]
MEWNWKSNSFVAAARIAMACRFEIIAVDEGHVDIHAVLERALDEVEQLEAQLNPFVAESHISDINKRAHCEPVKVEPQLYQLLKRAVEIGLESGGAFDITVGAFTLPRKRRRHFTSIERSWEHFGINNDTKPLIGLQLLHLDDETMTVRFLQEGIMLDPCGIAKGYAVDSIVSCLRREGLRNFFVHAGKSSIYASGALPHFNGWLVGITNPKEPSRRLAVLEVNDIAIGVSEWYDNFACGRRLHIFDPRTQSSTGSQMVLRAYAICRSATDADALSTAFLLLGCEGVKTYCERHHEVGAILVYQSGGAVQIKAYGIATAFMQKAESSSRTALTNAPLAELPN